MRVSELVDKLKALPQDADVVIHDADTDWLLCFSLVYEQHGRVILRGHYGEELKDDKGDDVAGGNPP
jgi:hypothetical protein